MENNNSLSVADVDGNIYKTVKIGNQIWMAENLRTSTFRNGEKIEHIGPFNPSDEELIWKGTDEWITRGNFSKPASCEFNFEASYNKKYGLLYNWAAVNDPRGLAIDGWHIPTKNDWEELIEHLGGDALAFSKLKHTHGWYYDVDFDGNGNNISGFGGLPGGICLDGHFCEIEADDDGWVFVHEYFERVGEWWSSSVEKDSETIYAWALKIFLYRSLGGELLAKQNQENGLSVRCIKNNYPQKSDEEVDSSDWPTESEMHPNWDGPQDYIGWEDDF